MSATFLTEFYHRSRITAESGVQSFENIKRMIKTEGIKATENVIIIPGHAMKWPFWGITAPMGKFEAISAKYSILTLSTECRRWKMERQIRP